MTLPSSPLFRRNLKALSKHQPALAATLKAITQSASLLERDADGIATNVCIGSERLYATAAQDWAADQVKGFLAESQRILFSDVFHCNVTDYSLPFHRGLIDYRKEHIQEPLSAAPIVDVGYLFVFGVGLGYHLEELMLSTPARHLILIEPIEEFLLHSLSAIDWAKLYRLARKRGQTLHIITAQDPTEICQRIEAVLIRESADFIDGSYFFFHYYSWALKEAYGEFVLKVRQHYYSSGFFEDELKMMTNACANMRRNDFYICEDKPFVRQSTPVFIVGSGPSLDNDIDFIRKWRDKVILVSSGTSLGILLKHGLRPDIHTELENGPQIYPILAPLREKYGFEGIRLGASLTIDPAVSDLFDTRWFFLRTALSPSRILASVHKGLVGSDPTVANASFSVTAITGFTEIYLFGVDCGYREGTGEQHHSKDSIYFTEDNPESTEDIVRRHDRTLPGNFGGTFHTQWTFDLTGRGISEVKRRHRTMTLFNCSDGARIDGAQPKAAEAIDLSRLPDRHERVLEQVERQMAHYQPGELLQQFDREQLVAGCRVLADAVVEAIATTRRKKGGFWEFRERMVLLYKAHEQDCRGVIVIAGSTLLNMMRAAAFHGTRIEDPRLRRKYFHHVLDELQVYATTMFEQTAEFLETLLAEDTPVS